ncbi:MAG TPA: zf-HC2 domain-containing protein [Pyrinomonadaceae bacterium]|jgi:DNA-binding helix-hairpin-helix protein with protein kinase domain
MKDQADTSLCVRATDLIAYLYGEASETEALDFEAHMQDCATCEAELEGFGQVRASIVAWRQQAIGPMEATAMATEPSPSVSAARVLARKPSALAALREFFALSPTWLRAATAFASLALCALIVFAAQRLLEEPRVLVLEKVVEKGPSQAEINGMVAERVREELALRERREDTASQKQLLTPVSDQRGSLNARTATASRSGYAQTRSLASSRRAATAQVSTQESEQLARDLQLIPTRDEDDLPRLIDLMDEAN